jgi:2-keto-4-pentenoate hydratase/2-oxohepta-3-ene-1,7-dioic acid hydratase in catechol pathway
MRLVTYGRAGGTRHGLLDGERVLELGDGDLMELVAGGRDAVPTVADHLTFPLAEVELLAPLLRPGKLLAAAANYQDHVAEGGGTPLDKGRLSPRLFLKPSSSIVGPDSKISVPEVTREMDWEAELGVVIGRRCRDLTPDRAQDAIFGYLAANDVSARSLDFGFVRDLDDAAVRFFDWLEGKWLDGFAPMGPWLVTADEVPDPQDLAITLRLNGEVWQNGSTASMIFSVAELVAFASRLMTLEPGDVLLTGTPAGTGAASGRYLRPGDEMVVSVSGLGTLTTRVV